MRTIHVGFCGFWQDFNVRDNFILDILRKKYDVTISESPDFLFYSTFSADHLYHTDCVKIFYSNEAISPDFNECDYAVGFDYISFDDRYLRVDRTVAYDALEKVALPQSMAHRKFCNFVYFNTNSGEGSKLRQDFCQELMRYKHVDCPGKSLNNMQNAIVPRFQNWEEGKLQFIKEYKFSIAFENCSKIGYVTEKIMQPLAVHSVPIYWGDPEISREFNPKAFVNCHDFANFAQAIEYIKYLDNDHQAYMNMLCESPMQAHYVYKPNALQDFLYTIVERGNVPFAKDPRNNWDTKKEIIKKLLEEACFFHSNANNGAKVEEYCGLALCLDEQLKWPHKTLAAHYKNHENTAHLLPHWHQEKLLNNMTLGKNLAEALLAAQDYERCAYILHKILLNFPKSTWPLDMLKELERKHGKVQ